jgi:hypothetical protein
MYRARQLPCDHKRSTANHLTEEVRSPRAQARKKTNSSTKPNNPVMLTPNSGHCLKPFVPRSPHLSQLVFCSPPLMRDLRIFIKHGNSVKSSISYDVMACRQATSSSAVALHCHRVFSTSGDEFPRNCTQSSTPLSSFLHPTRLDYHVSTQFLSGRVMIC